MSKRSIGLAVVATLAFGVSSVAAASATTSAPALPRVLTCAGKAVVKPASYVLSCADANIYFDAIHWTSWGATSAAASATFVQNMCTPTCAQGRFVKHPAALSLSSPRQTKYGRLFSAIHYSYTVSASSTLPLRPLSAVPTPSARPRCSPDPEVAAEHIIPPPPFSVRDIAVHRLAMPPSEPKGKGPSYKRLYSVRFYAVRANAVLPAGHTYTQFSYVSRQSTGAPWCFLKGGSGP